jgi:chromosome segregation ATPase
VFACAGNEAAKKPITVSESDYGRLQPGQTHIVDAARADLGNARDALSRAKLRQTEAKHEVGLVQADLAGADAEQKRADARTVAAKESNDPVEMEQARAMTDTAQLHRRAADAHAEYAKYLIDTRAAEVAAAEKRIAYEELRVEQAKLQALHVAVVPAATKYDAAALDAKVAAAHKDLDAADSRARSLAAQMKNASAKWVEITRQLQARGGAMAPRG